MKKLKRIINEYHLKQKLKYAFHSAELYKVRSLSNGKLAKSFPKIHEIKIEDGFTRYTFTLLNGMNPSDVKKKEFVFRQVFGNNIEIKGDLKKYVLHVYNSEMKKQYKYKVKDALAATCNLSLPVLCGINRHGHLFSYDMVSVPHLLIGGRTGSGKSTQLRQLLTTLILSKRPEELELYLGDCKKAEFHLFRNVEHVKANVVQETHIQQMLIHLKTEMDKRADLLDVFAVAHIDDLPKDRRLPYIVLCIDEFVMLRKNKLIMDSLLELTALGRALGIFVILSMQRPVASVLDTTARSNLSVAMGFRVRDAIESKVLCTPGAEKITVQGRFYMDTNGEMTELQSPLLTLEEAKKLLEPFKIMPSNTKPVNDSTDNDDSIFGRLE
ncbi:FtsK/SpoIIIE domain-containing protein [Bacillus amyloliquefaciens]|uniref:FtsK/SpoIIIE domain-containing protein n=1 Tax=Bacillus amyloliquefaciens TaxID=1390 RepID=UPI0013793AFC|nr:FtsK/SpoIIIE domain-containing protein [Bacillus amyloliquefaciens]